MRPYRLRNDLQRVISGAYQWPLGVMPDEGGEPRQGWMTSFNDGSGEHPPTTSFHVLVSCDRLKSLVDAAFELLPDRISAVVELGSADAYRRVDVFMSAEPVALEVFRDVWEHYEPFLLEDASMALGACGEDPLIEVFLEQDKVLHLHVPPQMAEAVEAMLTGMGLAQVESHWTTQREDQTPMEVRPVLVGGDGFTETIDDLLLDLKLSWDLVLNIDPERNIDDGGRELGMTLWHALVVLEPRDPPFERSASASVWATASSLAEMHALVDEALAPYADWSIIADYAVDRVALDERPDDLSALPPRRRRAAVHIVDVRVGDLAP